MAELVTDSPLGTRVPADVQLHPCTPCLKQSLASLSSASRLLAAPLCLPLSNACMVLRCPATAVRTHGDSTLPSWPLSPSPGSREADTGLAGHCSVLVHLLGWLLWCVCLFLMFIASPPAHSVCGCCRVHTSFTGTAWIRGCSCSRPAPCASTTSWVRAVGGPRRVSPVQLTGAGPSVKASHCDVCKALEAPGGGS